MTAHLMAVLSSSMASTTWYTVHFLLPNNKTVSTCKSHQSAMHKAKTEYILLTKGFFSPLLKIGKYMAAKTRGLRTWTGNFTSFTLPCLYIHLRHTASNSPSLSQKILQHLKSILLPHLIP